MNLVRKTVVRAESESCEVSVSEKAQQVLGYQCGVNLEASALSVAPILEWLREHDVRPFMQSSVERYKFRKRMIQEVKTRLPYFALAVLLGLVSFLFGYICEWGPVVEHGFWRTIGCELPCIIIGALAVIFVIGTFAENGWVWQSIPIHNYSRPIPEFALQTAIDIAEAFPHPICTLSIMELVKDKSLRHGDPFLCLNLIDGTMLYLEVWNEPGFKRVREV